MYDVCRWFCRAEIVHLYGQWKEKSYFDKAHCKTLSGPSDSWPQQLKLVAHNRVRQQFYALLLVLKSGRSHPKPRPIDEGQTARPPTRYLEIIDVEFFDEVKRP